MAGLLDWITGAVKQQYAQGAPYREAIGGLLQGDPTKFGLLAQEFNRKAQTPEGALDVALNFAPLGITAFHGSPASFDKFDLSKVGTGTGIQNYGHGFYFTESPEVAKQYAKENSSLYKVDIKDEILPSMVEWDKPFNKQPKVVKDAFKKLQAEDPYLPIKGLIKDNAMGGSLMQTLPLEKTNQMLSKYGVTGVKYADKTAKAQNYVVFDPEMIKILERKKGLLENSKTPFELAHMTAQKNAALPVEKGGLGLPKNNTAMDRAKAMGFDVDNIEYHTTDVKKIPSIYEHGFMNMDTGERNFKHLGKEYGGDRYYATGQGNYTSSSPFASWFTAQGKLGADQAMLPLVINKSKHFDFKNPAHIQDLMTPRESYQQILGKAEMNPKDLKALQEGKHYLMEDWITLMNLKKRGYTGTNLIEPQQYYAGEGVTTNTFKPSNIRSINAAFDPFRRNEADILAGLLAVPATQLMQPEEKKKKRNTK